MMTETAMFGELTRVRPVRRQNGVCSDRALLDVVACLLAEFDPAPFGSLCRVKAVTRH